MKKKIDLLFFTALFIFFQSNAQYVKVKLNFPSGVMHAPAPAPFSGAIWIGPEWKWNKGVYVHVPGYWAKPKHHKRNRWIPGHWKYSRRGYIWVSGRWH